VKDGIVKGRLGVLFWRAMVVSFLIFWAADLLTSAILVRSGFGYLEGNASVRIFYELPSWQHLLPFLENQSLYLIPLVLAFLPYIFSSIRRLGQQPLPGLYLPAALIVSLFALDRLNLGVSSNSANLIAIWLHLHVPAFANLAYALWGVLDAGWAASVGVYLYLRRSGGARSTGDSNPS
jgi:hypothetical protein